jgi:hypothetical protein
MADKKTGKKKAALEADDAAAPATEKGTPPVPKPEVVRQPKTATNIKKEKLAPKNKSRLPRRQKKAEKKKAAAARV